MSASYFKLKMLKNKRIKCMQQARNSKLKHSNNKNTRCRICLNEGIIPIYGNKVSFDLPEAIQTIGGVKLEELDQYPKYLCEDCHSLLKGAVFFRKSARETDEILRQISADAAIFSEGDVDIPEEVIQQNEHICKACHAKFISLEAFKRHKHTKKREKIRIQCRICKKLVTKQLYEKHLTRHQSASHLVCEVCGKLYRKDNLLRHLQLHSTELPFQCQVCPYRGRFMESLKIHLRTHSGEKPFSCDNCELRFITRSNLNRHLLTHKKEKPHKCAECSRGFYTQRDLNIHVRADHAGIKEFGCRVCSNKYGTKKALMRHELQVHKRDKMAKGRIPLYLQMELQNSTGCIALTKD